VLIVEDDPAIRRGQADALQFAGYRVLEAADGAEGLALSLEGEIDLVMLDVMLPGLDGFQILEQLRAARPTLPVIMVTAKGAEDDRVRGLCGGADDYVTKPFSARELLARVEAVLRRSPERPGDVQTLRWDGAHADLARREVRLDDGDVRGLSPREADILRYLAVHGGRAVDRRELLHRVWGLDPRGLHSRTVDMHIARLREKLAGPVGGDEVIVTVRSKGYMLASKVQIEPARAPEGRP
jgi:DNA-binding response OmpR family regulator